MQAQLALKERITPISKPLRTFTQGKGEILLSTKKRLRRAQPSFLNYILKTEIRTEAQADAELGITAPDVETGGDFAEETDLFVDREL